MLATVRAFSSWELAEQLLLDDAGRAETDLLQIRDITGLGPVAAAINTSPFGSLDGDSYTGSSVGRRNIVMTIKPNPNWDTWTFEKLRSLLYTYFMPKQQVRLVFETDEIAPVEITGYVESVEPVLFSLDGEIQVSVICPYPYFTAVSPTVVLGVNTDDPLDIDYDGSIATGINVEVSYTSGASPTSLGIQVGDPAFSFFQVTTAVDASNYLIMNAIPGQKYIRTVNSTTGIITNLLSEVYPGSEWPVLKLGLNEFSVLSDAGVQDWKLTYFKRYGGL